MDQLVLIADMTAIAVLKVVNGAVNPGILILEAPMGCGSARQKA